MGTFFGPRKETIIQNDHKSYRMVFFFLLENVWGVGLEVG